MSGWLGLALLVSACAASPDEPRDFPVSGGGAGGKEDVFGRKLAGVAAPYDADATLDGEVLRRDARKRRVAAWATARKVLEEVPLLGLAGSAADHPEITLPGGGDVPRVPRFETWYGVDDLKRAFQHLYEGLGANGRAAHVAFEDAALGEALAWNAAALDRSDRWPLERYFDYLNRLGVCPPGTMPDECARLVQGNLAGATAGTSRILYSPATARHLLASYRQVVDCLAELDSTAVDASPKGDANFTLCFERELPRDAALVKAQWVRADLGKGFPAFDTDGAALARRLGGTADWGDEGDRRSDPSADEIYTVRLRDGSVFRLAGLHIMTKEARHWQWLTLWWSDRPDDDFGADRPAALRERGVWRNYKMCAASWYLEGDADPAGRFADAPSLADALRATGAAGKPTWCSNPYVEHGRGNARTNCIGCHQHGGATTAFGMPLEPERIIVDEARFPSTGRAQLRELFPADYLYSFNRVDDWSRLFQSEMSYFERADLDAARPRIRAIQALTGVAASGGERFAQSCARCHGDDGGGSDGGPDLHQRVPLRDDESLLRTLIQGKGGMPRWGERLADQDLADVLAYLRQELGQAEP